MGTSCLGALQVSKGSFQSAYFISALNPSNPLYLQLSNGMTPRRSLRGMLSRLDYWSILDYNWKAFFNFFTSESPLTRLAELFNVNHFIVSQANPYIVPFLGKGLLSHRKNFAMKMAYLILTEFKHRLSQVFLKFFLSLTIKLFFFSSFFFIFSFLFVFFFFKKKLFLFLYASWISFIYCRSPYIFWLKRGSLETWQSCLPSRSR